MQINTEFSNTTKDNSNLQSLWVSVLCLMAFGILFIYSSSGVYASQKFNNEFLFVKKQIIFAISSVLIAFAVAKYVPLNFILKHSLSLSVLLNILCLLSLTSLVGKKTLGASRWIEIGGFQFQPSEFLKISIILYASKLISNWNSKSTLKNKIKEIIIFPITFMTLLLQPDFGSCLIIFAALSLILFVSGVNILYFIFGLLGSAGTLFVLGILEPYRMKRLTSFLNPFADPLGSGFQTIQSLIAVAGGGFFGKGIGNSQQKLFFLPEAHTDFIFAVIAEEMGVLGVVVVILVFCSLLLHLVVISNSLNQNTHKIFAIGLLGLIGSSFLMNIMVVCGLFPTKGLALPFVSAGGTSLISNTLAIGLVTGAFLNQTNNTQKTRLI
jgi:cell division protein FtsW